MKRLPSKGNDWWLFETILAAAENGEQIDETALDELAARIYRMREGERIQDVFEVRVQRGRPVLEAAQRYYEILHSYVERHAQAPGGHRKLAAGYHAAAGITGESDRTLAQHVARAVGGWELPASSEQCDELLRESHARFRETVKSIKGE